MDRKYITTQMNAFQKDYMTFMNLHYFPDYALQTQEVSQIAADSQGFGSIATALYQPSTNQHTLIISTNIPLVKHLMYHEFTHILDSETLANSDKMRYVGISGYTEYHASQIELAMLVGAVTIDTIPKFSMNTILSTFSGEKSVSQYVHEKYQLAIDLFSRKDFPANIQTLKTAFGVLHNHWGLRSICEMYATDYSERIDNMSFLKFIPSAVFSALNRLMHGWLNKTEVDACIPLYTYSIFPIIKDHHLA